MSGYSSPNQRAIRIHREAISGQFISISSENWMAAARDLGAHAFRLYLYFAKNKDGYTDELSPAAIREMIGMPESTYRDQFKRLLAKGYLVKENNRYYDFYEKPVTVPEEKNADSSAAVQKSQDDDKKTDAAQSTTKNDTEILYIQNNKHNKKYDTSESFAFCNPKEQEEKSREMNDSVSSCINEKGEFIF